MTRKKKAPEPPVKVLVVGDAHIEPGQSFRRFEWLCRYIEAAKPEHVVLIGDWVSMNSLSSFDRKGGTQLENTRVLLDAELGRAALNIIQDEAGRWPIHFVEGNHEYRIKRWWENDAQMEGLCDLADMYDGYIDSYTTYGDYLWINEIGFTHIPFNKVGPIASSGFTTSIAQKVSILAGKSIFFGHSHILDIGRQRRLGSVEPIYAVNVGCFIPPEFDPAYSHNRLNDWWRGVVMVDIMPDATFDISTLSLKRMEQLYG